MVKRKAAADPSPSLVPRSDTAPSSPLRPPRPPAYHLPLSSYLPSLALHLATTFFSLFYSTHPSPTSSSATSTGGLLGLLQPLIKDAPGSLTRTCTALVFVQLYFASQLRSYVLASPQYKSVVPREEMRDGETPEGGRIAKVVGRRRNLVVETCSLTLLISLGIFALAILLGAPVKVKLLQTYLLSLFIALLAFTTPLYCLTSPFTSSPSASQLRYQYIRLFVAFEPRTELDILLSFPTYFTIVGALVGAIPLALDWEEDWQRWPVTCVVGSYAGWVGGQGAAVLMIGLARLAGA